MSDNTTLSPALPLGLMKDIQKFIKALDNGYVGGPSTFIQHDDYHAQISFIFDDNLWRVRVEVIDGRLLRRRSKALERSRC